jgi:hypothetical protein
MFAVNFIYMTQASLAFGVNNAGRARCWTAMPATLTTDRRHRRRLDGPHIT